MTKIPFFFVFNKRKDRLFIVFAPSWGLYFGIKKLLLSLSVMENYFSFLKSRLQSVCAVSELHDFVFLVGHKLTGLSDVELLTKDCNLNESQLNLLEQYLNELSENRPIQYVLGETQFCGFQLKVDERVLIPRPETEELVDWMASSLSQESKVLDIGTGSGCIAIAVAKLLRNAQVVAYDVSEKALALAAENALMNNAKVMFRCVNILNSPTTTDKFDAIVSNPPYVLFSEQKTMAHNVLDYEPHRALFVPDENPLLFYRAIIDFAKNHLRQRGCLFFEINSAFAQQIKDLLLLEGFSGVCLRKDMFGNDRMIKAEWQ